MGKYDKLRQKLLSGAADAHIAFSELCQLLKRLGFDERIRVDHHIFTKSGVTEIINLQPKRNKVKAYQVKQVRDMMFKYRLGGHNVD